VGIHHHGYLFDIILRYGRIKTSYLFRENNEVFFKAFSTNSRLSGEFTKTAVLPPSAKKALIASAIPPGYSTVCSFAKTSSTILSSCGIINQYTGPD